VVVLSIDEEDLDHIRTVGRDPAKKRAGQGDE
jgi:hypothetical protein